MRVECEGRSPAGSESGSGRGHTCGRQRFKALLLCNVYVVGIVSLVWLMLRSGRKPSRLSYPCQQAALLNTSVLFAGSTLPVVVRLGRFAGARAAGDKKDRSTRPARAAETAVLLAMAGLLAFTLLGGLGVPGTTPEMRAAAAALTLPGLRSSSPGASDIFVAENIPPNSERGVDMLIDVMDANGMDFFRTSGGYEAASTEGPVRAGAPLRHLFHGGGGARR